MNVFSYSRVSSKGQIEGDGPERQNAAIASFCQRHNLTIQKSFDEAITGTTEERPEFTRMLEWSEGIDAIVVERMDRLARDLMVSEILLRECREHGLKLFCADQGELIDMASDDVDPTRKLIRQMLGALAEWEKSALVKKLRLARERTGHNGGAYPFGYYPNETEAHRFLIKCINEDKNSFARTAARLNEKGFPTRHGSPWKAEVVRKIYRARYPVELKSPAKSDSGRSETKVNLY